MQCAAVIARSPCGLSTTAAVQKCPSFPSNSAPTAGVPSNATAVGGEGEGDGDGEGEGEALGEPA
jgi:hypothetical protein